MEHTLKPTLDSPDWKPPKIKTVSKFLSYVLRHDPGTIGIELDAQGWANIEELIARAHFPITRDLVDTAVRENTKQRFAISDDGLRIRARQGHSFPVDLGLEPATPPTELYHGTAEVNIASILATGLIAQTRQHVHLSPDTTTARAVGMRHGKPVIFRVAAAALHAQGHVFYLSENGVWLIDAVPPEFLSVDPA